MSLAADTVVVVATAAITCLAPFPYPPPPLFFFFLLWVSARKGNMVLGPPPLALVREWSEASANPSPPPPFPASELKEVGEDEEEEEVEQGGGWKGKKGLELEEETSLLNFSCRQKAHTPPAFLR